jgi:hypothetical protein
MPNASTNELEEKVRDERSEPRNLTLVSTVRNERNASEILSRFFSFTVAECSPATLERVMNLEYLIAHFRVARNEDMPRIVAQANADPRLVMVRDMYHDDIFSLNDMADGPYSLECENGLHVIVGTDKKTGVNARARIVNDVVEVINGHFASWTKIAMGSVKLYVPV